MDTGICEHLVMSANRGVFSEKLTMRLHYCLDKIKVTRCRPLFAPLSLKLIFLKLLLNQRTNNGTHVARVRLSKRKHAYNAKQMLIKKSCL